MAEDPDAAAALRRRTGYEAESVDHAAAGTVHGGAGAGAGAGAGESFAGGLASLLGEEASWAAEEGGMDTFDEVAGGSSHWWPPLKRDMGPYAGFWVIGVINNFGFVVMLTAAETILTGGSGYVLAADVGPSLLMKVFASTLGRTMQPLLRTVIVSLLGCSSFLIVVQATTPAAALVGVGVGSAAAGLGEAGFLSYTSRFSQYTPHVVGGWSSGTGFSGVVGAVSWVVLREWLGLDSTRILKTLAWVPIIMLFAHVKVLAPKENSSGAAARDLDGLREASARISREQGRSERGGTEERPDEKEHRRGLSTASLNAWVEDGLQGSGEGSEDGSVIVHSDSASDSGAELEGLLKYGNGLSAARLDGIAMPSSVDSVSGIAGAMASRVHETMEGAVPEGFWVLLKRAGPALPPVMVPLLFVYFFEYLINQALFLPLGFVVGMRTEGTPGDPDPRHTVGVACSAYAKFQMSYQVGVMLSRTSLEFFKWERPLWHLSALQGINFVALLLVVLLSGGNDEKVNFNLPLISICLFAVWEGLIGGATYVNGFHRLTLATTGGRLREFAMGVASIADGVGILCAGLTAAALEPALLAHMRGSDDAVCE